MILATLTRNRYLRSRRLWGAALAVFLGVVAVGLIAPIVDASRYGERIRQTLQATLGRKVEFEAVHFTLFSGPGFSLEGVTIGEDPRYGIECFAFVPELQVTVRPDKLLFGQVQISSLRLLQPALNLVKRDDGTWNALELVQRLGAPRRMPLNFFPVLEVLQGRIDFKFGIRKTTLYLLDSDFAIFPERSNQVSLRFSGSPARTDRAGNGFGHLHGTVNWRLNRQKASDNQLDANLILDPSNLSEMATLVEGHDVGVHGTVASHAVVSGPLSSLSVHGQMQLSDLHRWDLLPASGDEWQVPFSGTIDLIANRLLLKTGDRTAGVPSPVTLQMLVSEFLTSPRLALTAQLERVPAADVLPLGRRMGLAIPSKVSVQGNIGGEVSFTNQDGLSGHLVLENVSAALPQQEPLQADRVEASLKDDRLIFHPSQIKTSDGTLQVGGEVWLASSNSNASITVEDYPITGLTRTLGTWLGSPAVLQTFSDGRITGALSYRAADNADPVWAGKMDFDDATMRLPGLSVPLSKALGRVSFSGSNLDVTRFSARAGDQVMQASYRYNSSAKRTERIRLELPKAELGELEKLLAPTIQGEGWLARIGVMTRAVPVWLANRDMDADLTVKQFSVGDLDLGTLTSQVTWQGTTLRFSSVQLRMPAGTLQAHGTANLISYRPKCSFTGSLERYPWRGGLLNATGEFETLGLNEEAIRNLRVSGKFEGVNLRLNSEESFPAMSGDFKLSYAEGWPDLRFHNLQALDRDGAWSGAGNTQNDGRLILDLERRTQQRRVIGSITEGGDAPALLANH